MLICDNMTGLGIELNKAITANLVQEGIAAFRANKKYIDYATDWYIQTTDKEVVIAMSATDGFLSGCAHNNFSENKYRIHGWLECFFAMKNINPRDVQFNHYCGFNPFNRDKDYTHLGTNTTAQFHQTVERFGAWSNEQGRDIKPNIEIQNWHGDTKLNKFIAKAERYARLIDPAEYIRYVNEDMNRHLFTNEIGSVFPFLNQEQREELVCMAVLTYGPVNSKTWFEATKEAA